MATLDELQIKIVNTLRENAKLTGEALLRHKDIAERLGVSTSTVSRHIAELEKAGIIIGYAPVIDPYRVGVLTVILKQVKLHGHQPHITEPFEAACDSWPHLVEWSRTTGQWDYLLKYMFRNTPQADSYHSKLIRLPEVKAVEELRVYDLPRTKPFPVEPHPLS